MDKAKIVSEEVQTIIVVSLPQRYCKAFLEELGKNGRVVEKAECTIIKGNALIEVTLSGGNNKGLFNLRLKAFCDERKIKKIEAK